MILIIVAVATAQSLSQVDTAPAKLASDCGSCHGMDKQVQSWQHSAHKDAACTACHADPGALGWARAKYDHLKMTFTAKAQDVDLAKIATDVPNERCIACHARQMPWVMQDLKPAKLDEKGDPIRSDKANLEFLPAVAGHDVHLSGKDSLKCIDCHFNASHGPADQPDKIDAWHKACLDCHAKEKVTLTVRNAISCSACHVNLDKVAPPDHQTAEFRASHGKTANTSDANCQQCHLNPGLTGKTAMGPHGLQPVVRLTPVAGATTVASADGKFPPIPQIPAGVLTAGPDVKDACASCHGITMPHPKEYLTSHAEGFKDTPELCATCHGTKDQGFNMTFSGNPRAIATTDKTCTECHGQPMPHPESWLGGGHQAAAENAPQTCEQCHSAKNKANPTSDHSSPQYCLNCHLTQFRHPAGFTGTHGKQLANYGGNQNAAGCTQCHTATVNSCARCHTNGVGNKQAWHPANWVGDHKATLAAFKNNPSAAGCTTCHSTTSNSGSSITSCTECHKSGSSFQQQWHPTDWVGSHKNSLASYNGNPSAAGCTQCHSLTDKNAPITSCAVCHTSGAGAKQQWHPNLWFVSHARTTNASNEAACLTCHSYIQPKCSQCHSKR
jgi:hypothetical protein